MTSYYQKLTDKVVNLKKHENKPFRLTLKLLWWCIHYAFYHPKDANPNNNNLQNCTQPNITQTSKICENRTIAIAIFEGGGIGDILIQTLYIKELKKKIACDTFFAFASKCPQVYSNFSFIDEPIKGEIKNRNNFDVIITSRRMYSIDLNNPEKIKKLSPWFYKFCIDNEELRTKTLKDSFENDNLLTQYAQIFNKSRIEQANILSLLPISKTTNYFMKWDGDIEETLKHFNLFNATYITISRAVGTVSKSHPKLWPLQYFEELCKLIHNEFPQYKLVQIGANDTPNHIKNVDIDLVGKTSIDESKILLKYSFLHIDVEGGLVHLKRTLNGKSIVIFGPTSQKFFGYDQNINLRSDTCPHTCEWVSREWTEKCLLTNAEPACMLALKPQTVFNSVRSELNKSQSLHRQFKFNPVANFSNNVIIIGFDLAAIQSIRQINKESKITVYDEYDNDGIYFAKRMIENLQLKNVELDFGNIYNIPIENNSIKNIVISESAINVFTSNFGINHELCRVLDKDASLSFINSKKIHDRILSALDVINFNENNENNKFISLTLVQES